MLKEEAHHMFVGTTGIDRIVERTVQIMKEHDTDDVRPYGGLPLDLIQRYLNFHYSVSLDLFGSETSTNVANYFSAGLKGRWSEERRTDDHRLTTTLASVDAVVGGQIGQVEVPALVALNSDLRREYIADCQNGVDRWNRILAAAAVDNKLRLPHVAFNRKVGAFAGLEATPAGEVLSTDEWELARSSFLPTDADKRHVKSLMQPVLERGKIAGWIAPPKIGTHGQPFDYDYVHFA
jgi:benzoyl-CoA 2,3-dioxygenase component B